MSTTGSIINSKPDQSKLKQLRSYLLIACIGEFFLYCLWYVLLAIRAIRTFLAYGMWSGPSNAILFMAILVPILYTASIIQLLSRTKDSSPTKKWIGTLIVLNLA
jgi:hypothetical protein